jgi:predicted dehydrogenase
MSSSRRDAVPSSSSRRDFLRNTTAGLAAVSIAGCAADAASTTKPAVVRAPVPLKADKPLRIAVVGVGNMGGGHVEAFMSFAKKNKEKVQVTAIADVAKPHLDGWVDRASKTQGMAVRGYRDYRELLKKEDVHGVVVATPEHWHAQNVIDCLGAGKDVYVEKPMTLKMEDAFRISDAVAKSDRLVQVGTQYMMLPRYREARKLVESGVLGHITLLQTSYCRNSKNGEWLYEIDPKIVPGEMLDWDAWCGPNGSAPYDHEVYHRWRRYRRWSTGVIGDLLVHQIDAARMGREDGMAGARDRIGRSVLRPQDGEPGPSHAHRRIRGRSHDDRHGFGVQRNRARSRDSRPPSEHLSGGNNCVLRPERVYSDDIEEDDPVRGNQQQDELRLDWLRCIRTRQPNQSQVELGAKIMVIVDLATRSIWGGGAWTFDPATRKAAQA